MSDDTLETLNVKEDRKISDSVVSTCRGLYANVLWALAETFPPPRPGLRLSRDKPKGAIAPVDNVMRRDDNRETYLKRLTDSVERVLEQKGYELTGYVMAKNGTVVPKYKSPRGRSVGITVKKGYVCERPLPKHGTEMVCPEETDDAH
jgi:hypothetical protein